MSFIEELAQEKRKARKEGGGNILTINPRKRPILSLIEALNSGQLSFICEIKRASPTEGILGEFDPRELARLYEISGASAISVLTEENYFNGSLHDLEIVKKSVKLPVLRKDFIVDKQQLYEAYVYGADAVLLIVSILKEETRDFVKAAHSIGLECLVEIHNKEEIQYALESDAKIIGVNSRDLSSLKIDLDVFDDLIPLVKKNHLVVAESGIKTKDDIQHVKDVGADAVLIGTSLVSATSIRDKLMELMS